MFVHTDHMLDYAEYNVFMWFFKFDICVECNYTYRTPIANYVKSNNFPTPATTTTPASFEKCNYTYPTQIAN